jgi:hypothetical protein
MTVKDDALKGSGGRLPHAVASAEACRTRNLRVQQSHEAEGSHASKRMLP